MILIEKHGPYEIVEDPAGSLLLVGWGSPHVFPPARVVRRFELLVHERKDMAVNAMLGSMCL